MEYPRSRKINFAVYKVPIVKKVVWQCPREWMKERGRHTSVFESPIMGYA